MAQTKLSPRGEYCLKTRELADARADAIRADNPLMRTRVYEQMCGHYAVISGTVKREVERY